jgi:hypothetical protein
MIISRLINVSKLKIFLVKEMFQLKETHGVKINKWSDKEKIQQVILDAGHPNRLDE